MRIIIILFVIVVSCLGCNKKGGDYITMKDIEIMETGTSTNSPQNGRNSGGCLDQLNYIPDPNNPNIMPLRQVKLNFHIMRNSKGEGNFTNEEAESYIYQWITTANNRIKKNPKMHLPVDNNTPNLFPNYQYVKTGELGKPSDNGIYYHNDDELYYFVNSGKNRNDYDKKVFDKYGVQKGKVLNVFMMPHHPDSIKSKKYRNQRCGIAFPRDNWTKLAGMYFHGKDTTMRNGKPFVRGAWACHGVFNHELGHVLGLRHSWSGNDGCEDTPHHINCFSAGTKRKNGDCSTEWSNNVMDYNTHQNSWTPCQIGIIQKNFANKKSTQRNVLVKNWCTLNPDLPVVVNEDMIWKGSKDLESHIIVKSGNSLTIKCRVSLPKNAYILVEQNARLILDGCTLENDCGEKWDGIRFGGIGKNKGRVLFMNNPTILNMRREM